MIKKGLKIGFLSIVFFSVIYLVYSINSTIENKEELAMHLQTIPSFSLKSLSGNTVNESDLKGKKSIIIYYGIDCSFCESEALQLKENKDKIEDFNILMVAQNTLDEQTEFRDRFDLKDDNFHFVYDEDKSFYNSYGIVGTPTILLYNENGRLLKKLNGSASMDIILEHLTLE